MTIRMLPGLLCLLPVMAFGQNYQGMSEADMQRMVEQGQKMQACMAEIDQSELDKLEQRSREMEHQVRDLCSQGKRDKAMETAMAFGKEIGEAPVLQQIKQCSAMMEGMMQMMPPVPFSDGQEQQDQHVCDGF